MSERPHVQAVEASNTQAILLSQSGHLWNEMSAWSWGFEASPRRLPLYVLRFFCAPLRIAGLFFDSTQTKKPLASVRVRQGHRRSVQGHAVTQPQHKHSP